MAKFLRGFKFPGFLRRREESQAHPPVREMLLAYGAQALAEQSFPELPPQALVRAKNAAGRIATITEQLGSTVKSVDGYERRLFHHYIEAIDMSFRFGAHEDPQKDDTNLIVLFTVCNFLIVEADIPQDVAANKVAQMLEQFQN